jgi:ubiquitin-like protein Pup
MGNSQERIDSQTVGSEQANTSWVEASEQRQAEERYRAAADARDGAVVKEGDTGIGGLDALLDEIEIVLETDAQEYVRSYVQKGGE